MSLEETTVASPAADGSGRRWWPLGALGIASSALYGWMAFVLPTSNRAEHVGALLALLAALFVLYGLAVGFASRQPIDRSSTFRLGALGFGFALLFRLLMVGAGLPAARLGEAVGADLRGDESLIEPFLLYDNDLWRYLWDGHVTASGSSPYAVTPAAALVEEADDSILLAAPWSNVLSHVSYQRYVSVYPPLTQYFFAGLARVAPGSILAAKGALAMLDLGLCGLLWWALPAAGRSRAAFLVYAWNPTVVKEFAGSGHPDVLMMLPLTLAAILLVRRAWLGAGLAFAAAVLAKLAPLALLPIFARRGRPALAALMVTLALGWWPLLDGAAAWWEGLRRFLDGWTFNSGPWSALHWLASAIGLPQPATWADAAAGGCLLGVLVLAWRHLEVSGPQALYRSLFWVLAAVVLLSPAVMPWYVLWALPFAILAGNSIWPVFTGLAMCSYLFYIDPPWPTHWKWLEYGALLVLVVASRWTRRSATTKSAVTG